MDWVEFRKRLSKYQTAARNRLDERVNCGDTDSTFGEYTMQEAFIDCLEKMDQFDQRLLKIEELLNPKE